MRYGSSSKSVAYWGLSFVAGMAVVLGLGLPTAASAQDRDGDRGRRMTRIEPGTIIPVRTEEAIDVERKDNRVYTGVVDQDVRGENDRLGIPRGSRVELMVRVAPDNDLILDLDSVMVNGQRYAIRAEPDREESRRDDGMVSSILESAGVEVRGRTVRIPRDAVLSFRIKRPLWMGVADEGYMRDGHHYHHDQDYGHYSDNRDR